MCVYPEHDKAACIRSVALICICLTTLIVIVMLTIIPRANAFLIEDDRCLVCHNEPRLGHKAVAKQDYAESWHGRKHIDCVDCHVSYTDKRHPLLAYKYDPDKYDEYLKIFSSVCKTCHKQGFFFEPYEAKAFGNSIHKNLECSECHGYKPDIHKVRELKTLIADAHNSCSRIECHGAVISQCNRGMHDKAKEEGKRTPGCVDCHGSHWIQPLEKTSDTAAFKNLMLEYCITCHPDSTSSGNYHFQALVMGRNAVPSCFNCHGAHDNERPQRGEDSTIEVCRQCHVAEIGSISNNQIHANKYLNISSFVYRLMKKVKHAWEDNNL